MKQKIKHLALHRALYSNDIRKLTKLLAMGANINEQNSNGLTVLHLAAEKSDVEVIKLLQSYKANGDIANRYDELPLHLACKKGHLKTVSRLIKMTNNINKQDRYGNTALHFAIENGEAEIVKLLLRSGIVINYVNEQGFTALALAEYNQHTYIANLLKRHNAKKTMDTITAIKYAYKRTHISRKLAITIFAILTISLSTIATIATGGELILSVFGSLGASLGMLMVCLEKPYRELRSLERYKFNQSYDPLIL
jgi:ankyrin repeat protein